MRCEEDNFWNLQERFVSHNLEVIEVISYSLIAFALPFILGHPQWLVGTIVNAFLMRCAISFRLKSALPVIIFPSLGVLCAGLLFGGYTSLLLFFIPVIWIGNLGYGLGYKYFLQNKKISRWCCPTIAAFFKAGILFSYALLMVFGFGFPAMFLTTMGIIQLITALSGGYIGLLSTKII